MEQIIFYYDQQEIDLDLVVECYEVLLDKMRNYQIKLLPIETKIKHKIIQQE